MELEPEDRGGHEQAPRRVIIADDHELARLGLRTMLSPEPDLEVVGEAATGREAIDLTRKLEPDLVLMDIRMPDLDGLAATRAIKEALPRTSILIVTLSEDPDYLMEAMRVGASGFVLKDASRREVVLAVRQVLTGESPLDPKLSAQLIRRLAGQATAKQRPASRGDDLTPRELEVLRLVAEGKTNAEIGQSLFVSVGTVKVHVERIINKLGVSDRTQAAVRGVELGYLTPPFQARTGCADTPPGGRCRGPRTSARPGHQCTAARVPFRACAGRRSDGRGARDHEWLAAAGLRFLRARPARQAEARTAAAGQTARRRRGRPRPRTGSAH